jgi:hypothetical protein
VVLLLSALVSWLRDDNAQTLSYEHYYPYGGTAIIAGKDKTQTQQKRYRYTGKERDGYHVLLGLCI